MSIPVHIPIQTWARCLLCCLAFLYSFALPSATAQEASTAPSRSPWFHQVNRPVVLSSETGARLCRWIQSSLAAPGQAGPPPAIPGDLRKPSVVLVSCSSHDAAPSVRIGTGSTLAEALREAVRRHPRQSQPSAIRLDIVQDIYQHPGFRIRETSIPAPGLSGIAFSPKSGLAFLPAELIAVDAVDAQRRLQPDRIELLLARRNQWQDLGRWNIIGNYIAPQPLCFFECQTFFLHDNKPSYLFRGHRMMQPLSLAELKQRTKAGADFMTRTLQKEPRDLRRREVIRPADAPKGEALTLTDAAGCALALMEYARLSQQDSPLQQARTLLEHVRRSAVTPPGLPETMLCLADDGAIRLGTNALALLAFLGSERDPDLASAVRIGRYIAAQARADGRFIIRRDAERGTPLPAHSANENAQAILALFRLYEATSEPRFRQIALRGLNSLLEKQVRGRELMDLPQSPWILEALNAGYTFSYKERRNYSRAAQRIAMAAIANQTLQPAVHDELGAPRNSPSATQAAMQTQLLAAAADVLRAARRQQPLKEIRSAMHGYLMFQLQAQLDAASTFFLPDPSDYLGAFRDDAVVIRFRPVDQWVQLRSLVAAQHEFLQGENNAGADTPLPLSRLQKKALLEAYRGINRFPRALPR